MSKQITKKPNLPVGPTKPNETIICENDLASATLDGIFLDAELNPEIVSEYFMDSYDKNKHFVKIKKLEKYDKYADCDFYEYYIVLFTKEIKPNKNYAKEMKIYKNLKNKYDKDLAKYYEDLKSYQETQNKIQELKNQIKDLGGEIE